LFSSVQRSVWMWQDVGIADDIWIRQLCHKLPSSDARCHHVYVLQPLDGLSEFNKRVATMDQNDTPIAEILGSCLAAAPMPDAHIIGDRQTDEHHQRLKSTMRGEGYTTDIAMLCCLSFMSRPLHPPSPAMDTIDTTGDLTELRWKVKVYGHAHRKSKDYRDSLANLNFFSKGFIKTKQNSLSTQTEDTFSLKVTSRYNVAFVYYSFFSNRITTSCSYAIRRKRVMYEGYIHPKSLNKKARISS